MTDPAPPEDNGRTKQIRADIRDALTNLPDAYALLSLFILPGSAPPDPDGRIGKPAGPRSAAREGVMDLMDDREKPDADPQRLDYDLDRRAGARRQGILPTLSSWVRLVDGELWDEGIQHQPPDDVPTVAGECSWLLRQVDWIAKQQWADELAGESMQMFKDVCKETGWAREEPTRCPKCGWIVEARDGGTWWSCTGCPQTWAREAEINRFVAEQEYVKTLRECAVEVGRPVATLKDWRSKGWIQPKATSPRGVQLFDSRKVSEVSGRVAPGRPTTRDAG